jgi:hypothetical protein
MVDITEVVAVDVLAVKVVVSVVVEYIAEVGAGGVVGS